MYCVNKTYFVATGLLVITILGTFVFFRRTDIVNYPPQNETIVAFGDSLIKGVGSTDGHDFISLLSQKIGRPIVNEGVPGETSAQGLARIDGIVAQKPGTVIVLFGGNDYLQKVPQQETFSNLRQIIIKLQSSGSMVVLLGVRGGLLNDRFDSDFESLARETGAIYVSDVLDGLIADSRYMSDAVHPNNIGYAMIAERVYGAMEKHLK